MAAGGLGKAGMQPRISWTVVALAAYGLITLIARQLAEFSGPNQPMAAWMYAASYALFGAMLLGAVARWWRDESPALWRPLMLGVGGLAAALEIWIDPNPLVAGTFWDRWMLALFGLLAVALAARFIPSRLIALWLGVDRRLPQA